MNSCKIGFLVGSLSGAGAEKTILTLSRALRRLGCRTEIFALTGKIDYPVDPDDTIRTLTRSDPREQQRELAELIAGANAASRFDLFVTSRAEFYDCIPVQNKYCSVHITPTAWIRGSGVIDFFRRLRKVHRLRKKFRHKQLIALSEGIKTDLVENLHVAPANVRVIHNPFDVEAITQLAAADGALPDAAYIIYVAAMIPRKRHADLLQAFAQLPHPELKLVLVGKGVLLDEIRNLAAKLGIASRVVFWGWDANPYRLIRHARLSVLASEAEGMPRVLIESLLIGTPVVSTNCPSGPSEVLTGALSRFLVPVGDIAQLSQAMDNALQQYPEIDQNLAVRFGAEHVAQQYLELINERS